jgi:N-glycosylase/DNA lyase
MTPKIYEAVGSKLVETWGDYAGWAHSVLFTADLRSFASYGLPTPAGTPVKQSLPPTPVPLTPSESDSDYFGESPAKKRKSRTLSPSKLKRVKTE